MFKRGLILLSTALLIGLLSTCTTYPAVQSTKTPVLPTVDIVKSTVTPTKRPLPDDLADLIKKHRCSTYGSQISPSSEWHFFNYCLSEYTYPATEPSQSSTSFLYAALLYNQVTIKYWLYSPCQFIQGPGFGCNPQAYLKPIAWSPDNKYLYAVTISGSDSINWFGYMMNLIRIDLDTGVANIYMDLWAEYSLSPDTTFIAYIPNTNENGIEVYVRDLKEYSDFKFVLDPDFIEAGDINWSPDGTLFVFLAVNGKYPVGESISLMLVDISDRNLSILINDFPRYIYFKEWRTDGTLAFYSNYGDETILYNIEDRQLFVTPMP